MATKLEHSVSYPFSTQRLWEVISTEQYWLDLIEAINSSHGSVKSFAATADTVTVELQQGVPAEKLPSAITKIKPGDLMIPRRNEFRLVDGAIAGKMTATVEGAPVKVDGTVSTSGDPARTTYSADVAVSIPLLGGKIEKSVVAQLTELLDAEHEQTLDWEAANRLT